MHLGLQTAVQRVVPVSSCKRPSAPTQTHQRTSDELSRSRADPTETLPPSQTAPNHPPTHPPTQRRAEERGDNKEVTLLSDGLSPAPSDSCPDTTTPPVPWTTTITLQTICVVLRTDHTPFGPDPGSDPG
ncbi:uncharacterized protein V6R79_002145 [Siganus canaliculatus]